MAKFDIFNKSSWTVEITDREKTITNKAVGRIGQMISEIRDLRANIEKTHKTFEQTDYSIAQKLLTSNSEAYRLMQISYETTDNQVTNILTTIDEILTFWSDKTKREHNWRCILPKLQELQPYLSGGIYGKIYAKEEIEKLVTIKVSGNKAWDAYLNQAKETAKWYDCWKKTSAKLEDIKSSVVDEEDKDDYDYCESDE
jgi:hypothetical protein